MIDRIQEEIAELEKDIRCLIEEKENETDKETAEGLEEEIENYRNELTKMEGQLAAIEENA